MGASVVNVLFPISAMSRDDGDLGDSSHHTLFLTAKKARKSLRRKPPPASRVITPSGK
jgi:hypothetical protein